MTIGIVPMGGSAQRWAPLVTPKELLPFGTRGDGSPAAAADCVIDAMTVADVSRVLIPILPEKAGTMMRYFGSRLRNGALVEYIAAPGPTLVANIAACLPLIGSSDVLFGMPDTHFTPAAILLQCWERLKDGQECVLGVFPCTDPEELDLVLHREGCAEFVLPKPRADREHTGDVWGVAAWNRRFTERISACADHSVPLGTIFSAVAAEQRKACGVVLGQSYVDLGSYSRYARALIDLHAAHNHESCTGNRVMEDR